MFSEEKGRRSAGRAKTLLTERKKSGGFPGVKAFHWFLFRFWRQQCERKSYQVTLMRSSGDEHCR